MQRGLADPTWLNVLFESRVAGIYRLFCSPQHLPYWQSGKLEDNVHCERVKGHCHRVSVFNASKTDNHREAIQYHFFHLLPQGQGVN
jgi:hypothetical protein